MSRKLSHKKFLLWLALLQIPLAVAVALFNYYIDPMWCFPHANRHNSVQADIEDRQQKTNYLTYGDKKYDTLIIGNSRVKMMCQYEFSPGAFNYAVNGMTPKEYRAYIDYAKKMNGKDFDTIVIGLSFAMTNKYFEYPSNHEPTFYFDNANRFPYRYVLLLSGDILSRSWANFKHALKKDITVSFDRNTVEHINKSRINLRDHLRFDLTDTRDTYRSRYVYLEEFRSILEGIKKDNPKTKFIVFTTPVSEPLYSAVVTEGRWPEYRRWLKEIVDVFGEVHHFEYLNSVTRDYHRYFMDGHHYFPETASMMIHRIKGVADPKVPADFGMLVNSSNLEEKLREIEAAGPPRVEVKGPKEGEGGKTASAR